MSIEKIPSLNGIRAISITIVLLSHLKTEFCQNEIFNFVDTLFPFITDGQLGVNVFFILSGFLITFLLIREHEINNSISLKKILCSKDFKNLSSLLLSSINILLFAII